jgi:adenosine deaminase
MAVISVMLVDDFIRALPKAELHLHLEGAIPWEIVREFGPENPETPIWWAEDYRFDDCTHFGEMMRRCHRPTLTSLENYRRIATGIFESLHAQNTRYVELSFSPEIAMHAKIEINDVAHAIKESAPEGMSVCAYCGINRQHIYTPDDEMIQAIIHAPDVDGIDLHGDERYGNTQHYAVIFDYARDNGKLTRAHAGELLGAEAVRDTLDYLKVTHIEHGVGASGDEDLLERIADEGITLDVCVTSNVKLRVIESIEAHPIRKLVDHGILVTINTDDPTLFGGTLTDELHMLVEKLDFSLAEIAQLQKNAFMIANIDDDQRDAVVDEIDALLESISD